MDDRGLEGKEDQTGVEAHACFERGLDPALGGGCGGAAIGRGKRITTGGAISEEHRCFAVVLRSWIFSPRILEEVENGQLNGIRNKIGMKIEGTERLFKRAQIFRAPEDTEQAERSVAAARHLCTVHFGFNEYQPNLAQANKKIATPVGKYLAANIWAGSIVLKTYHNRKVHTSRDRRPGLLVFAVASPDSGRASIDLTEKEAHMPSGQPGTQEDFEVVAQAIWDGLPEQFRAMLGNGTVHVADFADAETLNAMRIRDPYGLLGLYHGVGLPSKSVWDPASLPDRIFLYRIPILSYADENVEPVDRVIRHVLIHEIGHHFGFSDAAMARLESGANS